MGALPLALGVSCSPPSTSGTTQVDPPGCELEGATFEVGGDGHPDPFGAKAAGQARAGRLTDVSGVAQPAHGRAKIEAGDVVLVNDRVAITIEDAQPDTHPSDGYSRFGGEILAADLVGDDGRPRGLSTYNETLMGVELQTVRPTSVSVLADGSDGGPAVVRVTGPIDFIPFLKETLGAIFTGLPPVEVAYDYSLAPGDNFVRITLRVLNANDVPVDLGLNGPRRLLVGMFHGSYNGLGSSESGFAKPPPSVEWAGFDGPLATFAMQSEAGPLEFAIEQSGFQLFWAPGTEAPACDEAEMPYLRLTVGGPEWDDLREAVRESNDEPAWKPITGTVSDALGGPVAGAWVHLLDQDGAFLSRTKTSASGAYTLHGPPNEAVRVVAEAKGYPTMADVDVTPSESTADLAFGATGTIHIDAFELGTTSRLPVRVQVIPSAGVSDSPDDRGVRGEANGRLWQTFALDGLADLRVPPGEHRVVVSRGYEWELLDTTIEVGAGETVDVLAELEHSVDTAGVMCGDFHIHSWFSADSSDDPKAKVAAAVADGLEVPCSSEHEWVIDFQPIVEELGVAPWAFGMASEELTTFVWGHFGVVPLSPDPTKLNNGAVDWVGKSPAETFGLVRQLPEDPVLIVNHPSGSGFGAYFSAASLDTSTGEGNDLWSDDFDAVEVFNDSDFESNRDGAVADWFGLLKLGHKFASVGSSDSHSIRTSPVGYPRTCMGFGHDDPTILTPNAVRDALGAGRSYVSGGLYLTVTGPAGEGPGDTISTGGNPVPLSVVVEAPSWVSPPDVLEVIVDGDTVETLPLVAEPGAGTAQRFVANVTVTPTSSSAQSFVVLHVRGTGDLAPLHPGKKPFAVSNPILLTP